MSVHAPSIALTGKANSVATLRSLTVSALTEIIHDVTALLEALHLTFDGREPVDLPFSLAVAPVQRQRRMHGLVVYPQAFGERCNGGTALCSACCSRGSSWAASRPRTRAMNASASSTVSFSVGEHPRTPASNAWLSVVRFSAGRSTVQAAVRGVSTCRGAASNVGRADAGSLLAATTLSTARRRRR